VDKVPDAVQEPAGRHQVAAQVRVHGQPGQGQRAAPPVGLPARPPAGWVLAGGGAAVLGGDEVRRLSVEALRDTRAVVQGYRRTALDDEIANATRVLAAAEIDARMRLHADADGDRLPEVSRHLLGLVMREATTNVLRHSRARRMAARMAVAKSPVSTRTSRWLTMPSLSAWRTSMGSSMVATRRVRPSPG
jgi:hypothetical protein